MGFETNQRLLADLGLVFGVWCWVFGLLSLSVPVRRYVWGFTDGFWLSSKVANSRMASSITFHVVNPVHTTIRYPTDFQAGKQQNTSLFSN